MTKKIPFAFPTQNYTHLILFVCLAAFSNLAFAEDILKGCDPTEVSHYFSGIYRKDGKLIELDTYPANRTEEYTITINELTERFETICTTRIDSGKLKRSIITGISYVGDASGRVSKVQISVTLKDYPMIEIRSNPAQAFDGLWKLE